MTDPDVLKGLKIKRYEAVLELDGEALFYVKLVEDTKGDLVFVPDLMAAIRRGDLIPRSRIEEKIKRFRRLNQTELSSNYTRNAIINVLERLLKETKP